MVSTSAVQVHHASMTCTSLYKRADTPRIHGYTYYSSLASKASRRIVSLDHGLKSWQPCSRSWLPIRNPERAFPCNPTAACFPADSPRSFKSYL